MLLSDGTELEVGVAFKGAEGRYEDYVYLKMLEREWKRTIEEADRFLEVAETSRPSAKAGIALIFWSYFETRIERLMRQALLDIPSRIAEDLLKRNSSINAMMNRLYEVLFESTYLRDLKALGYGDVATLLQEIQRRRNRFAHGYPPAIDDDLITRIVESLQREHESWIAVFNWRARRQTS